MQKQLWYDSLAVQSARLWYIIPATLSCFTIEICLEEPDDVVKYHNNIGSSY